MKTNIITKDSTNKKLLEVFNFLFSATSNDLTKPVYVGFYFDGDSIITTDTRRLHIVEHDSFKDLFDDGLYKVEKIKGGFVIAYEIEGTFPNYKRVLLNEKDISFEQTVFDKGDTDIFISQCLYSIHRIINVSFMRDILKHKSIKKVNIRATNEYSSPVELSGNIGVYKFKALVMPVKVEI